MKKSMIIAMLVAGCAWGCNDDPSLNSNDREVVFRILQTGVDHPSDPYTRAETLRVIELLNDPALDTFAKSKLKDSSPMVRVIALRALLRTGKEDLRSTVLEQFANTKDLERSATLDAVLDYGPEPLARELLARAMRSKDADIRRHAFERGMIARVDEALAQKNTKYLERTLYPELAQYVGREDPVLGAIALRKFLEVGQVERAEPIIRAFQKRDLPLEERVNAAKVLVGARAKEAVPTFTEIVEKYDSVMTDDSLGVPDQVVPPPLLRQALLGLAATGDETVVKRVQAYLNKASVSDTMEVLEALASNPSADAGVSLKIAMQDVRDPVRELAIELYQHREDADPDALSAAMIGTPYSTQRRVAEVLIQKYPEAWVKRLTLGIQRPSERDVTLRVLRDVILTKDEATKILAPLHTVLNEVANGTTDQAPLAAYLVAISSDPSDEAAITALDAKFDDPTRYAFLEFMVRENLSPFAKLFTGLLDADSLFRLMSAADSGGSRRPRPPLNLKQNERPTDVCGARWAGSDHARQRTVVAQLRP
ncbi:MAG: hypothetical protein R3E66_11505 [bacterium]